MTYPHTATVHRQTKTGLKYEYGSVGTTSCFLQPLDEESGQLYGITFGQSYHAYIPFTADVLESDRLIIDGATYGVKGVRSHNYGSLKHKRLILEKV